MSKIDFWLFFLYMECKKEKGIFDELKLLKFLPMYDYKLIYWKIVNIVNKSMYNTTIFK